MNPPIARRMRLVLFVTLSAPMLLAIPATAGHGATLPIVATLGAALSLCVVWVQLERLYGAERRTRSALRRGAQESQALLRMTGQLQRCRELGDVEQIVAETAVRLLPGSAGTLHIMPRAADRASRSSCWGGPSPGCLGGFQPGRCAALRHGRMQLNAPGVAGACPLAPRGVETLCLPAATDSAPAAALQFTGAALPRSVQAQRLALAIAEATGFALENLAIRESLRGQALRDPLTGLHNRRFLDEVSATLAHQAARRGAPLAVAMLDVDHFKRLNDEHGHAAGDAVLRDIGTVLAGNLRQTDIACRHGVEEFVLLLPDCDAVQAWGLMDALRQRIVARRLGGATGHRVTCSIGVSALAEGGSVMEAIAEADAALYAAKRAGRNRVVLASRITAAAA